MTRADVFAAVARLDRLFDGVVVLLGDRCASPLVGNLLQPAQ